MNAAKHQNLLLGLLPPLAALALFAQTLAQGFTLLDDPVMISAEPRVMGGLSPAGVWWAFTQLHYANWHPLTTLSLQLDATLWGDWAGGFHLQNGLWHALASLLCYVFLLRATGQAVLACAAATLFALHPLHVEPVAWAASRKDVLSGACAMAALVAYHHYAQRPSVARYAFVVLAFAAALLGKAAVLALPLGLLALDYWPLRRCTGGWRCAAQLAVEKVPLLALSAAAALIAYLGQQSGGGVRSLGEYALGARLRNAGVSLWEYLLDFVAPWGLAPYYPHRGEATSLALALAGAGLVLALLLAAVLLRRGAPGLLSGLAWFLVLLFPALGLVSIGAHARADRFVYLPLLGLCIAAVWCIAALDARFARARLPLRIGAAVWCFVLLAISGYQTALWRDDARLYAHALAFTAPNPTAAQVLLQLHAERGDFAAVWEIAAEHAASLEPERREIVATAVARAYVARGRGGEGLDDALRFAPGNVLAPSLVIQIGNASVEAGDLGTAEQAFRWCIGQGVQAHDARVNLATGYLMLGHAPRALPLFEEALRAQPEDVTARLNYAAALATLGQDDRAREEAQRVLQRAPDHPGASALLQQLGG